MGFVALDNTYLPRSVAYHRKTAFDHFRIRWNYFNCVNGWNVTVVERMDWMCSEYSYVWFFLLDN